MRELEAVLEQAVIFGSGEAITAEDLDLTVQRDGTASDRAAGVEGRPGDAPLSWLQREALRLAAEQREVRRRDLVARCRVSREVARRALVGLVRLGLLRRIGGGRSARYVPPPP